MPQYNHSGSGIQWNFANFSGDQIIIGGGGGGVRFGSATPDKSKLTKIVIPASTRQVTVVGNRYEIDGEYYTDGSYTTA